MIDKISIIIPVYNLEQCLEECLQSVINQTYPNLEIILINDGSTDNSLEICSRYKKIDNRRIAIVNIKNHGVSYARNLGLKLATGSFISFIDGDDIVEEDFIETLYQPFVNDDSIDVAIVGSKTLSKNGRPLFSYSSNEIMTITGESAIKMYLSRDSASSIGTSSVNKLYKRQILANVFFDENLIVAEDAKFVFDVISKAKKIFISDEIKYIINNRQTSVTRTAFTEKKFADIRKINSYIMINIKENLVNNFCILICDTYIHYFNLSRKNKNIKKEIIKEYRRIYKKIFMKKIISKYTVFYTFPRLSLCVYKMLKYKK